MVPFDETLHGRAQRCVGDGARVYSFAASGAPLSQYLIWAEHARQRYEAQGLVFVGPRYPRDWPLPDEVLFDA